MTQPVGGPRLYHIEWLRVFLTVIVVLHHAAQPNGPASNAWVLDNPLNRQILLPFISLNSAYFM